jgi:hypothetical protein
MLERLPKIIRIMTIVRIVEIILFILAVAALAFHAIGSVLGFSIEISSKSIFSIAWYKALVSGILLSVTILSFARALTLEVFDAVYRELFENLQRDRDEDGLTQSSHRQLLLSYSIASRPIFEIGVVNSSVMIWIIPILFTGATILIVLDMFG